MIAIRIIAILLFLCYIPKAKSCSSTKLPKGDVLGCTLKNRNIPFDANNITIATDATCVVETEDAIIRVSCNGTDLEVLKDIEEPKSHIRRKRGWFRRALRSVGNFFKKAAKAAVCVLTLFSCLWSGRAGSSDSTPPGMRCDPPLIPVTAKPYEIYAYATWPEPTAHDETDGDIKPKRKSGRPPGSYFPEYDTRISYEAKDKSGNRAECTITVRVKIVRCDSPNPVENGYFQCNPVTDFLNGCRCRFGCYEGFDLNPRSDVSHCQENGQWSAPQPVCKPWKCDALGSLDGAGNPKCTNEFHFRSICVYNCASGFDMPPRVSKALVCDKTKTWRKLGEPKCVDVEAPTFSVCPSTVIAGTDTGFNSTEVSWKQPQIRDNSNKGEVFLKQGVYPGTRLTAGSYAVQYGAKDEAGNIAAHDCTFKVIVREIRCAKLYPTPSVQIDCPDGYRSGAQCNISCDPGKILVGSDNVECNRSPLGLFGVWNWKNDQQSVCKNGRACVSLIPPKNGAVACDNWEGGQYCQIQCKRGTEMSSVSLKNCMCAVVMENGLPLPQTLEHAEVRSQNVQHTLGLAAFYYFHGDCTTPETKQQIANNFIAAVKESLFQPEVCPDSTMCNPQNVQINCGESDRKKRSTHTNEIPTYILELSVSLPVTVGNNITTSDALYTELFTNVRNLLNEKQTEIFGNVSVSEKQFKSKGLEIHCPEGAVKSEQSLNCVDCPEGTYYSSGDGPPECIACRKGFYQNKIAQNMCIRCPKGTTTHSAGAESEIECDDACPHGSFSQDGLFPCTPCEQGEYQPSFGQTSCHKCSGSKSTLTFGSKSSSDCEDFDLELVSEERSYINITLLKNVTIQDFTLAFWFQSESSTASKTTADSSLTVTFLNKEEHIVWTWNNLNKVIQQDNTETDTHLTLSDFRWHKIILYNGPACDVDVTLDGAPLSSEPFDGICNDTTLGKLSVYTENGTGGSISQFNVWQGKHNTESQQRCFDDEVGDLFSWKNFEEANISGAYMYIPSHCDDFDNCVSSPCMHGSCSDALGSFSCTCEKGYVGSRCDANIDDCDINICMNDASCVDGVANYTCQCAAEYTGQYCEIKMVDGGWSEWGNWSECTTTCGDGEMTRKRLCNSPTPDNGGEDCAGETFDYNDCNNSDCPVCPSIDVPFNGSLDCFNDSESINCTVSCDDGFEFDVEPLSVYYCGPQTFHEWNFQTDENPERRLPKCVAIKLPEALKVHYSAHYQDLYCASDELEAYAREEINLALTTLIANVPCLTKQTCNIGYANIIDCDSKSRRRRTAETAGFSLEITNNPSEGDNNETMSDLEEAFQYIQDAVDNGELTVEILDDDFELDINQTDISGEVLCKPGETRVRFYCVPCGKGSYLYTDYCKPCPIGTYQDTEGQSSCTSCPSGKSTIGIRSTTINDCTVEEVETLENGLKVTWILVGSAGALVVVLFVFIVYRRYKSRKRKRLIISRELKNTPHGRLGPSKVKFDPEADMKAFDTLSVNKNYADSDISDTKT